ncbi:MAG TPA: DUF6382 domain-containing protein [Mobilitalea sp.]|nr:DUF6382 domain-containing protein [Mobilitalea sp.]
MEIEYTKDLHHSYMVLPENENSNDEPYCIQMLKAEGMEGILSLEKRGIDNKVYYYYDITAKQALSNLLAKSDMSYSIVKKLFTNLLETIEKAYEYLLNENDFVLGSDVIFVDLSSERIELCYLPGYRKDIKEQMCSFIEYIMNKVNYKDKEAVLLVYNLYAAGKEEGFTLYHLQEVVQRDLQPLPASKERSPHSQTHSHTQNSRHIQALTSIEARITPEIRKKGSQSPSVMIEKITGEREIPCYSWKTFLYTGICGLGTILSIYLCLSLKLIYNSLGNRIDYSKLFGTFLIIFCIDGYLMTKVWDKNKKITKLVMKQEYIDPRQNIERENVYPEKDNKNGLLTQGNPDIQEKSDILVGRDIPTSQAELPEMGTKSCNPTCLLNSYVPVEGFFLKPVDETTYESIRIVDFPFFIGKLKKNVDYCIEKDVVSRYHAKITREQEQYYLTDLNSTNGTFLNNEPLQTYQRREIKDGDEIAFANIKYRFIHTIKAAVE